MAQVKQQVHPHPHPKPAPTPEKMEEWRRLIRAQFGVDPQVIEREVPLPPDPALLQAGMDIIQGWGAPEPAGLDMEMPLPPPEVGTQTVKVYVWSSAANPNKSVRAIANAVADNPQAICADLQDAWIKAGG
jgi:hypothetical protein